MSELFDPLMEERVSPNVVIPRGENGEALIIPRGETEAVPYTRASSLAKFLAEDSYQLSMWRARYGAQGIARYPDLAARVAAVYYSTGPITGTMPITERKRAAEEIDAVWREAQERMGINEAANLGTAGHSLTEPTNEGVAVGNLVDVVRGHQLITSPFTQVAREIFVANDRLRVAGTFDSAWLTPEYPDCVVLGDTKTGKNYHQAEFEIQLASYQGGEVYLTGGGRITFEEYFGLPMNTDVAYLVHVSITGSPKPRIVKLDLARGRRLAELAAAVRDGRRELDKIGIGEKVNHIEWAKQVLSEEFKALLEGAELMGKEAFQTAARALWTRFEHVWPGEYNTQVMEVLT